MKFEEFASLVKNTRSVRRFKAGVEINNNELQDIIEVVRYASSALNKQPLKYICVTDKELVNKLTETSKWASHLTEWDQAEDEAPSAFIIMVNDTSIEGYEMIDCGISMQTIMLALASKGYAGCPMASIDKDLCKELFNLQSPLEPLLGIAVGVCDETINIVEVENGDTNYFRSENGDHNVPKRSVDELLIAKY